MLYIKTFLHIYLVLSVLLFAFLIPLTADAAMTSSQYSLESYSVGASAQNTSLTSAQYSLTPNTSESKAYSTTVGANNGFGSRGNSSVSEDVAPDAELVSGSGELSETAQNVPKDEFFVRGDATNVDESVLVDEVSTNDDMFNVLNMTPATEKEYGNPNGLSASVIEAIREKYGSVGEMFKSLFDTRSARLGVFVGVLGMLWYVRTFTALGIKYRPF